MILPDQTPKLPKWPFLAADAALLAAAWLIGANAAQPLGAHAIIAIAACVGCAGIAGAIPFLADYARRQDEALDNRQRALEALARHATAAAEQISIAATAIHEVAGAAHKGLAEARELPAKLQAQAGELAQHGTRSRAEDRKALEKEFATLKTALSEKLQAAADRIAEAAIERIREAGPAAALGKPPLPAAAAPVPAPPSPVESVPAEPEPAAPAVEPAPTPGEAATAPPSDDLLSLAAPPEAPAPKPPRKRAKKAPAEEPPPAAEAPPSAEPSPAISEFAQTAPDELEPPASIAADGASRLLVTAYIGIGNRLFIRGDGPGLNWEKGVPLQFVSIGKWRWDTPDATEPIRFKLFKNDEIECEALGAGRLDPGRQLEVTASF